MYGRLEEPTRLDVKKEALRVADAAAAQLAAMGSVPRGDIESLCSGVEAIFALFGNPAPVVDSRYTAVDVIARLRGVCVVVVVKAPSPLGWTCFCCGQRARQASSRQQLTLQRSSPSLVNVRVWMCSRACELL